jgi:5S rRNA maturation endonuclease (ribonuclease M5)/KaiC/GvpD/RAD55 family RecA-like ATPase
MAIPSKLIKEAKESLGERAANIIATGLNLKHWDTRNIKGCCPIHSDKTPSFAWHKKGYYFKCFGCGQTMDIMDYYINFRHMNFFEASKELFREANIYYDFEQQEYSCSRMITNKNNKPYEYPIPETNADRSNVEAYMNTRGISPKTLDARGIKQDNKGNLVFEYRNGFGKLMTVKYRPSKIIEKGETKTWCQSGKDTAPVLFGMDKIDITKPLLICEGEIDSLTCIEANFTNVVSVPFGAGNFHWIQYNWEWLEQFEKIIVWADKDEAGEKMRKEVITRLGENRCFVVNSPHKDINLHLLEEGKESVLKAINGAKAIPIENVIDLSDIQDFDINKAEKIKSGFASLDRWIGGFVLGTVNVITGYNSSGKSTLVNQMCIAEPLEQGYNTFIFSGELSQSHLRSWIQFPLAGPDFIEESDNGPFQPKGYTVPKEVIACMDEWYRGKIHVYNNEKDTTAKSILKKMEELTRRYGTKNFVLDNLMMIDLEFSEYELNKKQKEFLLNLKTFARRYNSVVHLIARPRKTDLIRRLTKLDVSGSGDITNLADYFISIHRVNPDEKIDKFKKNGELLVPACPFDNMIDLFKNRPLGHQDKTIGLYFHAPSKRLYGKSDDINKNYDWVHNFKPQIEGLLKVKGEYPWK